MGCLRCFLVALQARDTWIDNLFSFKQITAPEMSQSVTDSIEVALPLKADCHIVSSRLEIPSFPFWAKQPLADEFYLTGEGSSVGPREMG